MPTTNDQKSIKRDDDKVSHKGGNAKESTQKNVKDDSGLTRGGTEKTEPDG